MSDGVATASTLPEEPFVVADDVDNDGDCPDCKPEEDGDDDGSGDSVRPTRGQ